jgi:hemerythrin-like domain-containing protein
LNTLATRPTAEAYKELLVNMKAMKEDFESKEIAFVDYAESLKSKINEHIKLEETMVSEMEKWM